MSALPEQYRKYAAPTGQRPLYPAAIELHAEHDPIVWVPDAYGQMVPMRKSQAPTPMVRPEPRDLTPQPLFDPLAQRMFAGGVGGGALGAGAGWGAAQVLSEIAGAGTGLLVFALLLLLARLGGGRSVTNIRQEVHQHARFGKNQVTM